MANANVEPLFVTIVSARYAGTYEPGAWLAFAVSPGNLPRDWSGNDIAAATFFSITSRPYGAGASPDAAYQDLLQAMRELGLDPHASNYDWDAFTAESVRKNERDMLGR